MERTRGHQYQRSSVRRGLGALALAVSTLLLIVVASAVAEDGTAGIPLPPPPPPGSGEADASGGSAAGYPNASAAEAANLFTDNFSETIDSLASDPVDLVGEHPVFLDDHAAVISAADRPDLASEIESILERNRHDPEAAESELNALLDNQAETGPDASQLIYSTQPLRASSDGDTAPVDLSLDQLGDDYVPDNPLVDLKLPVDLDGMVAIGDQGIKLNVGAADPADANRVGGDNLFYADAAPATDVVLAPISSGLETFYQLRAPESPDSFRIEFTLPAGTELRDTGNGGAEIVRDGNTVASVYPPSATDAAGNSVEVTMSVDDDSLVLDVPHSDPAIRYPVSVDPVIDLYTWSYDGAGRFADWVANQTTGSPYVLRRTCKENVNCTSGTEGPSGLYSLAPPNQAIAQTTQGVWQYQVPHWPSTSTYISTADLGPMHLNVRTDAATRPVMFAGIFPASSGGYLASQTQNQTAGALQWSLNAGSATTANQAVFGLWSLTAGTLSAWRDAYLGRAAISLGDTESPTISNVNHSGIGFSQAPDETWYSDWVDEATPSVSFTAADSGLGVKSLTMPNAAGSPQTVDAVSGGCIGNNSSPCPPQPAPVTANYDTTEMPDGVNVIGVGATDALGKPAVKTYALRVDHAAPLMSDITGGLAEDPTGDPYRLHLTANDGNASSPAQWQSGVKEITEYVNGEPVFTQGPQACAGNAGSCALTFDHAIAPDAYEPNPDGSLRIGIRATDELGHQSPIQEWNVPIPNTSIDSGPSGPTSNPTPTFDYGSTISGSAFECRVDQGSFAACPASGYTVSPSLGDGAHTFDVRATDLAGHVDSTPASNAFTVDTTDPELTASGELVDAPDPLIGASTGIDIDATDPDSGITSVKVLVDDVEQDVISQDCPEGGCELQGSLTPELSGLEPGAHSFQIVAQDAAGNTADQSGTFVLDPSPPVLAITGDLAESNGVPLESDTASADIQAADSAAGDSGIATIEVSVDDDRAATEDQDCEPACPASAESTYTYDKEDWGSGSHSVTITATDAAGNQQLSGVEVDVEPPTPPAQCPEVTPTVGDAGDVVTLPEAADAAIAPAVAPSEPAEDPDAGTSLNPSLERPDESPPTPLAASGTLNDDQVPSTPAGELDVNESICLVPTQTTADETPAAIVNGDAAIYANSAASTDTIIRPTASGETVVESLRDENAPDQFSWKVGVQEGHQLVQLEDGGIAVVNPDESPPPDATVPEPPDDAQNPLEIPDAASQLATADYEIAAAEEETGSIVAAVIPPAYTVDAAGESQPATLGLSGPDTIVLTVGDAKAAVMTLAAKERAPDPAKSWYMFGLRQNLSDLARDHGCTFATHTSGNRLLVLGFGAAHKFDDGSYGTMHGDADRYPGSHILDALKAASRGYKNCRLGSGSVTIAYGNTNNMTADTNASTAGQRQAGVARDLDAFQRSNAFLGNGFAHENAAVAGDIEPPWDKPDKTKALVDAAASGGGGRYYDYGTAKIGGENAHPDGNWDLGDLVDVSYTESQHRRPLPEIYTPDQLDDWHHVQGHYNDHHSGDRYFFGGVTWQPSCSTLNPGEAWRKLNKKSNGYLHRELINFVNSAAHGPC